MHSTCSFFYECNSFFYIYSKVVPFYDHKFNEMQPEQQQQQQQNQQTTVGKGATAVSKKNEQKATTVKSY